MGSYLILGFIFALGILSRSMLLVAASSILSIMRLFRFYEVLSFLDNRGIKLGLLFLLLAVLAPIASGELGLKEINDSYKSLLGITALISGVLATQVIGWGINLLDSEPQLVVGILLGSIVGIVFFDGVPVGPLLAGGMTAVFYRVGIYVFKLIGDKF